MVGFIFFSLVFGVTVAVATIVAAVVEAAFGKRPAFGPDDELEFEPLIAAVEPLAATNCQDLVAPCRTTETACTTATVAECPDAEIVATEAKCSLPTPHQPAARRRKLSATAAMLVLLVAGISGAVVRADNQSAAAVTIPTTLRLDAPAVVTKAVYISQMNPTKPHRQNSATRGSAERGRALFFSGRLACPNCHTIDRNDTSFCPNLSAVGSRLPREKIVSSIRTPSLDIAPGYQRVTLTLEDGRSVSGFLRGETAEKIDLEIDDHLVHFAKTDVSERINEKSDMPEGLVEHLTAQEFDDLVEFLVNQKGRSE